MRRDRSDHARLHATFADLETYGISTSPGLEDSRAAVRQAIVPRMLRLHPLDAGCWAAWTKRDEDRCFDADGDVLLRALTILCSHEDVVRATLALLDRHDLVGLGRDGPDWTVLLDPRGQQH